MALKVKGKLCHVGCTCHRTAQAYAGVRLVDPSHSVPARLGAGTGLEDSDAQQYLSTLIESTMRLPEDKHIGIDETLQQTATIMRRTNTLVQILQELSLNYLMILRKAVS